MNRHLLKAISVFPIFLIIFNLNLKAQDLRTYPVLWHQTSAEYRALCYQAFNSAHTYLEKILSTRQKGEKLAIVTDIDETILDNSYMEAQGIKENTPYSFDQWVKWVNLSAATAIPGAVDFLNWAAENNVTVFYISNRTHDDIPATMDNLRKLNLPFADSSHMMFLADGSSKESRRNIVSEKYRIVMLLGDNLNDFSTAFEDKLMNERKSEVDLAKDDWGRKFIVLPNAVYGDWEKVIYDYRKDLTPEQKNEKRLEKLTGF